MSSVAVALGVFDGVHAGHRALIAEAARAAEQRPLVAVSFDPHPVEVLRPEAFEGLLTLPTRRAQLLRDAGVSRVEYLTFDSAMQQMSPDEFIGVVLSERLGATLVAVGSNFRFGSQAAGDVDVLRALGAKFGIEVVSVPLSGDGERYSSTRVRRAVLAGDVRRAAIELGRPHRLSGTVAHGDKRGRELGYPTANLAVTRPLVIPADGVYSAFLRHRDASYPAAVSIGTNPTFEGVIGRRVEAYALDEDDLELYEEHIDLDFIDFIRPMRKFGALPELLEAMAGDVRTARGHFADLG